MGHIAEQMLTFSEAISQSESTYDLLEILHRELTDYFGAIKVASVIYGHKGVTVFTEGKLTVETEGGHLALQRLKDNLEHFARHQSDIKLKEYTVDVLLLEISGRQLGHILYFGPHSSPNLMVYKRFLIITISTRLQLENEIAYLKTHDFLLTKLPNRLHFLNDLKKLMVRNEKTTSIGMAYVDIDRFRDINREFGHKFGDEVLEELGKSIQKLDSELPSILSVARMGGDEFAILFQVGESQDELDRVTKRIRNVFSFRYKSVRITSSIGIGVYPEKSNNFGMLLRNAEQAMYNSKREGRGLVKEFKS